MPLVLLLHVPDNMRQLEPMANGTDDLAFAETAKRVPCRATAIAFLRIAQKSRFLRA